MLKARIAASAVALALIGALGGCASPDADGGLTYAGRHEHQRDAKQGAAASYSGTAPSARATRGSVRPPW